MEEGGSDIGHNYVLESMLYRRKKGCLLLGDLYWGVGRIPLVKTVRIFKFKAAILVKIFLA